MKLKNSASGMFRETNPILVQRDYGARPNKPDIVQTRCRWIIGDVTEVLDQNTWKLGKIAKTAENNYFVIRLADCIQLKEFHISSLRVPVPQDPPTATVHCKQFSAADKANRRGKQLPADVLRRSDKKRKSSAVPDSPQPRQRRFQSAAAAVPEQHRYGHVIEETAECSVASCSANDNVDGYRCCPVSRGDAMSVVAAPCTSSSSSSSGTGRRSVEDDGVLSLSDGPATAMDVHELELEAYRSTVRALHASGPLTWEQESLLTNLRLSLNISNEEHLLQLRRLLSS